MSILIGAKEVLAAYLKTGADASANEIYQIYMGKDLILDNIGLFNYTYNYNKSYTITGLVDNKKGGSVIELTIPNSYKGAPITSIQSSAFRMYPSASSYLPNVQKIIFGENLEVIGHNAFDGMTKLKELDFSKAKNLRAIGYENFRGKVVTPKIIFPSSLVELNARTDGTIPSSTCLFGWGTEIGEIYIPEKTIFIGGPLFISGSVSPATTFYCEATKKPSGWVNNWSGHTSPVVVWGYNKEKPAYQQPSSDSYSYDLVDSIKYKFDLTQGTAKVAKQPKFIKNVVLTDQIVLSDGATFKVNGIDQGAFINNKTIFSVDCSQLNCDLPKDAFRSCSNLYFFNTAKTESFDIIGELCFGDCYCLQEIYLSQYVKIIYNNAFQNCHSLIIFTEKKANELSGGGWNPNNRPVVFDCHNNIWAYTWETTSGNIKQYVQTNQGYTNSGNLKIMVEKNNDEYTAIIRKQVPASLSGEITLPNEVRFKDGNYERVVTITTLDACAFLKCANITRVNIPTTISNIGPHPFCWCDELNWISCAEENEKYLSLKGVLFEKINEDKLRLIHYPNKRSCDNHNIINTVYTLPNDCDTIGPDSFVGNMYLEQVYTEQVKTIQTNAFKTASNLKILSTNAETIESNICYNCPLLQKIILGHNLKTICDNAFFLCSLLKTVEYNGTKQEWDNIAKGKDIFGGTLVENIICTDGVYAI